MSDRNRLLNILRVNSNDRINYLNPVNVAKLEPWDLYDLRNFGPAMMVECQKWLGEYGRVDPKIDAEVTRIESVVVVSRRRNRGRPS